MSIDMAQFHQVFFEESFEALDVMETGLLAMDAGAADAEEINAIFRAAHSIKGGSGTFGFMDVSDFTHVMETLLDEMRDGRRAVTVEAVNVLLRSVDVLREMLTAAHGGDSADDGTVRAQRVELEQVLAGGHGDTGSAPGARVDEPPPVVAAEAGPAGCKIPLRPHRRMMRTGNDPLRIVRVPASCGELEVDGDGCGLPSFNESRPDGSSLSRESRLRESADEGQIDDGFEWVEDRDDFSVEPILPGDCDPHAIAASAERVSMPAGRPSKVPIARVALAAEGRVGDDPFQGDERRHLDDRRTATSNVAGGPNSIRVDVQKIDGLINKVGELVVTQSMLSMLGDDFDIRHVERLREGLAQLQRETRELQESVLQIRMVPIGFSFSRLPRLVHDLSGRLGKRIELQMSGESTEVDKTVIEKIGDPLVHLVRNSLDHGIERPEERLAAGKPEIGTLHLSASHSGGNVVIEIRDDGRGLRRDKILEKATERGMVRPEEKLSDKYVYELIFQPGFSTADQVSDISGRGVGMDVVRRNVNALGGVIEIDSTPGEGSVIIIRLPLTTASLDR